MISLQDMVKKFKGQMVRIYTWKNDFVQGFFVGNDSEHVYTLSTLAEKETCINKTHITHIKIMLEADLLNAHRKVCQFLYSSHN